LKQGSAGKRKPKKINSVNFLKIALDIQKKRRHFQNFSQSKKSDLQILRHKKRKSAKKRKYNERFFNAVKFKRKIFARPPQPKRQNKDDKNIRRVNMDGLPFAEFFAQEKENMP